MNVEQVSLLKTKKMSSSNYLLFAIKYHQICQKPGSFVKYHGFWQKFFDEDMHLESICHASSMVCKLFGDLSLHLVSELNQLWKLR